MQAPSRVLAAARVAEQVRAPAGAATSRWTIECFCLRRRRRSVTVGRMNGLCVLVIDDSAMNRRLIGELLEREGAEVLLAASGAEGERLAAARRPDVIILDVVLPDADGRELCRRWRADAVLADIPVLLVSGERLEGEDRAAGLRAGAMGYLVKPFDEAELLAQVHLLDELGRSHRELKARAAQLEDSNRELQRFAYVVSHDLQEPLRTVARAAQALAEPPPRSPAEPAPQAPPSDAARWLRTIVDGTQRMQRLIDDLLAYSRAGRVELETRCVDLNAVVREVLLSLDAAIREAGATIELEPLPTVRGNPTLLAQLFQNLLSNAIKFRGSEPARVRVFASPTAGGCRVTVADQGIGIAPKHLDRIFNIFERLHPRDKYPGTGVGLAICKTIVERQGGSIHVESDPGRGSRFHVDLPIAAAEADEARGAESPADH